MSWSRIAGHGLPAVRLPGRPRRRAAHREGRMSVQAIPAGLADAPLVWPMVQELHRHERLPEAGPEVRRALEALLASPEAGRVLLARSDGRLAGYLALTFGCSLEVHGKTGLVDELFVAPDWRGRGLGGALLAEAERLCREAGARVLRLEVEHTNLDAQRLYAKRG